MICTLPHFWAAFDSSSITFGRFLFGATFRVSPATLLKSKDGRQCLVRPNDAEQASFARLAHPQRRGFWEKFCQSLTARTSCKLSKAIRMTGFGSRRSRTRCHRGLVRASNRRGDSTFSSMGRTAPCAPGKRCLICFASLANLRTRNRRLFCLDTSCGRSYAAIDFDPPQYDNDGRYERGQH